MRLAQADEEIAKREAAAAAEEQYQQKLQKLGSQEAAMQADALECQMQGQMAAAAASNPRALIDLVALATGAQVRDTCLRMKALRWQASGVQ
jgi:hypothetical protein